MTILVTSASTNECTCAETFRDSSMRSAMILRTRSISITSSSSPGIGAGMDVPFSTAACNEVKFDPLDLKLLGLGSTEPLAPNRDEDGTPILENQMMNRRVVIKVLIPSDIKRKIKLGLGVYFDD